MGDEIEMAIRRAMSKIKADRPPGREYALAVTKLEEALMWYEKAYSQMAQAASEQAGAKVTQNPTRP